MIPIKFNKLVYNKNVYSQIIDTSFKQLGIQTPTEQLISQLTVEEFFNNYNEIFYDIPEKGTTNSHEYLIKKSGEYINFTQGSDEIEALQLEISQLRSELLDSQKQIIILQTGSPLSNIQ